MKTSIVRKGLIILTIYTSFLTMGYNPRVRKTLELKKSPDIKNRLAKVSRFLICGTRIPRRRRVCARGASVLWHDAYGAEPYRSIIRKAAGLGFPARGGGVAAAPAFLWKTA